MKTLTPLSGLFHPKRNGYFLIILIALTLGCSSREKRYNDIDFMSYAYREVLIDSSTNEREWRLLCVYYALIDEQGKCKLVVSRIYPRPETKYFQVNWDQKLIAKILTEILSESATIQTEIDLRPKKLSLYDRPDFILKINKDNNSKIIHFREDVSESEVYQKLFNLLDSSYMSKTYEEIAETNYLLQRKADLIRYTIKSDSILRPLPPKPEKDIIIEYVPPKVVDTTNN